MRVALWSERCLAESRKLAEYDSGATCACKSSAESTKAATTRLATGGAVTSRVARQLLYNGLAWHKRSMMALFSRLPRRGIKNFDAWPGGTHLQIYELPWDN